MRTRIVIKTESGAVMKKSYLTQASANVALMKCVIGPDGVAVPKDYDRRKLREGDIGYENRLDRNQVAELTPAQRVTAIRVIHETTDELLALLGEEPEEDWKVGTVVEATYEGVTSHGAIRRVTENSIILSTISKTCRITRRELPRRLTAVDELEVPGGFNGVDGLILFLLSLPSSTLQDYCSDGGAFLSQSLTGQKAIEFALKPWHENPMPDVVREYEANEIPIILGKRLENQMLRANLALATRSVELLKTITDRVEIRRIADAIAPYNGAEFYETVAELLSEEDQDQLVRFVVEGGYDARSLLEKLGPNGLEKILSREADAETKRYAASRVDPIRISSQSALCSFICFTADKAKKSVALERLTDQELLCEAALWHKENKAGYSETRYVFTETGKSILARVTDISALSEALKAVRRSSWHFSHTFLGDAICGRITELEAAATTSAAPAPSPEV